MEPEDKTLPQDPQGCFGLTHKESKEVLTKK